MGHQPWPWPTIVVGLLLLLIEQVRNSIKRGRRGVNCVIARGSRTRARRPSEPVARTGSCCDHAARISQAVRRAGWAVHDSWQCRLGWFRHLATASAIVERIALGGGDLVLVLEALKVGAIGECGGGFVGLHRPHVAVRPHRVQRLDVLQGGDALGKGGFHLQGGDDLV
eukprot:scaffold38339_cov62-Phaeocystis_antarctica.AAC.1